MTEQELLQKADAFIDANINQIVQDIKTIVDIPSVKSAPQPGAPFGTEIRRALTAALGIAERMGFHTVNCDDYLGYAELELSLIHICLTGPVRWSWWISSPMN